MFLSRFMPCDECGDSVDSSSQVVHQCDPDRLAEFRMFEMRQQVADFEAQLHSFLDSPRGRFEIWSAARDVATRDSDA
jgi:hypothetical protein